MAPPDPFPNNGITGRIDLEVAALVLRSNGPVNLGFGTGIYFETLQSSRSATEGGPGLMGRGVMDIIFGPEGNPHGTFNSWLYIPIDLRIGSATAPIVFSDTLRVTATGATWAHTPPVQTPPALEIRGVNTFLNGVDRNRDFWPQQILSESVTSINNIVGMHSVRAAAVPEPGALVLGTTAALIAFGCGWGRRLTSR